MTVEEIEAQPEWYLNKDDNYWVDKHIKELKMESNHRTEQEKHNLVQFTITVALLTLFGALFLVIFLRISQLAWLGLKRIIRRGNNNPGMEFNSGESANDDDPYTAGHFEAQAETHELDMVGGNTDAVEMHRLDRPSRGQNDINENSNGSSSGSSNDGEDSEESAEDDDAQDEKKIGYSERMNQV